MLHNHSEVEYQMLHICYEKIRIPESAENLMNL